MRTKSKFAALIFISFGLLDRWKAPPWGGSGALLYAVDESADIRGSISVYDIEAGHRRIKTVRTVPGVADVRGVAAGAVTGKLYVAYIDALGSGMIYCLNIYNDSVLWNRPISPASIDWRSIRTVSCSMSRPGEAARPITIDRTTRPTR